MDIRVEKGIVPPTVALVLAALAYGLCVTAPFTFDDFAIFTAQPVTRPLTWLTYRLNGREPWAFHAVNLLLHLIAVWVAGDTLERLLPERAAGIATLIFAVHPAMSEAVNYVWARSTLLMTLLCLLCLRDWLRGRHWLAVLWFALALGAKEEAVAFPLFLAMLDRRQWRPIAAMLALAIGAGVYTIHAANTVAGSQAGAQSVYTPVQYLASEGLAILRYLRLAVVPWGFTVEPAITPMWWPAWIAVAAAAGFAATRFDRQRWGFWAIAALVLLLPTSSIFPANDLAADRRMYLPMFAVAACAGLLIPARFSLLVAVALTVLTAQRTWVWADNARLWSEAVEHAPDQVRPRRNLAKALPPAQAIPVLREAKRLAPDDVNVAIDLMTAFLNTGDTGQALAEAGRALALEPNNPNAVNARGVCLAVLGQNDAARADFQRAIQFDRCHMPAYTNLRRMGVDINPPADCRGEAQP